MASDGGVFGKNFLEGNWKHVFRYMYIYIYKYVHVF